MMAMIKLHPLFKKATILGLLTITIGCFFTVFGVQKMEENIFTNAKLKLIEEVKETFSIYEEKMSFTKGFVLASGGRLDEESFVEMQEMEGRLFDVVMYAEEGLVQYVNSTSFSDVIDQEVVATLPSDKRMDYYQTLMDEKIYIIKTNQMVFMHQGIVVDGDLSSVLIYGFDVEKGWLVNHHSAGEVFDIYLLDEFGNDFVDEPTDFDENLVVNTGLMTVYLGLVKISDTNWYLLYMGVLVGLFFLFSSGLLIRYFYLETAKSDHYQSMLTEQARRHRVTKLFNANQLYLDVEELILKDKPFYFALGHLNNIKHINNRFGHHVGEKLLQKLSKLLLNVIPSDFMIYHYGGDEYVVIGIDKTKSHFANTLKRILDVFDDDIMIDQYRMNLSMTFGVSHYPTAGNSTEQLINNAHISMRDVLNHNQNTLYFYEASKYLERVETDDFDQYVKRINLQSFELSMMPVVHTATDKIFAFECLSRLYDEFDQLMPTEKLINSLERVGRIQELDELVFEKMLSVKKNFEEQFEEDVVFSVNASAMSFNDSYVDHVIALKKGAQIQGTIMIELTESYKVEDYDYLLKLFKKLNKEGIEIGIDDFGSGYSSIGYIAKFPLYAIKVDKRFVRDYKDSLFNQTLIKTLISIGDVLGSKLVAEGVDTHETLAFLKAYGCPYYQGYLFHKGVGEKEVINLYKKYRQV